ncbi:MAG TPA: phage recombination protein Bet, partial [Trebonia sp.]|nr:phage recombination protein Bet [Trebonia sp.]
MTGTALAIRDDQTAFDDGQRAALAVLGVDNASQHELAVFLHACQNYQLDPFSKQIYFIKRDGRWTLQTGIDGFRVIRDRVARRDGVTVGYMPACWYDADGCSHAVWVAPGPPTAAGFTVLKDGQPFSAIVYYSETVQRTREGEVNRTWATRPAGQLAKCAEAAALRMAFPHDLSGLYIAEEVHDDAAAAAPVAQNGRVTAQDITGEQEAPAKP